MKGYQAKGLVPPKSAFLVSSSSLFWFYRAKSSLNLSSKVPCCLLYFYFSTTHVSSFASHIMTVVRNIITSMDAVKNINLKLTIQHQTAEFDGNQM